MSTGKGWTGAGLGSAATLAVVGLLAAGCETEGGRTGTPDPTVGRAPLGPPAGPPAPGDTGRLRDEVARQGREVVIVGLEDPLGRGREPAAVLGEASPEAEGAARAARVEARQADLDARKRALLAAVERQGGAARVVHWYESFALLALEVDLAALEALEASPAVVSVHGDATGEPALASSLPFVGAGALHGAGHDGAGAAVAVLDTAVRYWAEDAPSVGTFGTCPARGAFAPTAGCAVRAWVNVVAGEDPDEVAGGSAHGTAVAGIVHALAPGAAILGVNVMQYDPAWGTWYRMSDVIAGLDWVALHAETEDVVAVNLSLGGSWPAPFPCDSMEHIPASWPLTGGSGAFVTGYFDPIRTLWADHGVVTVVAAGNGGSTSQVKSPACVTLALAAAALFDDQLDPLACPTWTQSSPRPGEIACFSHASPFVDLAAPGVWIDVAGQARLYGTSFSAPHVAGGIAALQSMWAATEGAHRDAHWVHRSLMLGAMPLAHGGYSMRGLDLDGPAPEPSAAFSFPGFFRSEPAGAIPASPSAHVETATVSGRGGTVGGAYLYLEVVHPSPADLEVVLEAPSGATASVELPGGGWGLAAVVGREVSPGALAPLSGSPVDGTWTIRLADGVEGGRGHYVSATLFVVAPACAPSCGGRVCGDDGCGGTCGDCPAGAGPCSPAGLCLGCAPSCGGRACGDDRCGGTCGSGCDDGSFCDGWEHCLGGACAGGVEPCLVPDALPCTADCDEAASACDVALPGYCAISGACVAEGSASPSSPCLECVPSASATAFTPDDTNPCDDGDRCTAADRCSAGVCVGAAVACDDGEVCTDDGCEPATGCTHVANTAPCEDGDLCTGGDLCAAGACVPGGPVDCDDGEACTDDGCDPEAGCTHVANADPCDDGDLCTAGDSCGGGHCLAGSAVDCDDGEACTDDGCDPETGCTNAPRVGPCEDGDACTVGDTCAAGVCVPAAAADCDDGEPCTDDGCDPGSGCTHVANAGPCDDGDPCTVGDTCAAGLCVPGAAADCDDGEVCTDDACDPEEGCTHVPNTGPCDDGDGCAAGDHCAAGACVSGGGACDEASAGCDCRAAGPRPLRSLAGLLALAALLASRRRRPGRAPTPGKG